MTHHSQQSIEIRNAQLIDPSLNYSGIHSVFIQQGKIVGIDQAPSGFAPNQQIDLNGAWLAPGLVDLSARLREPGFEYKATLESEMQAAIAGGVTSLACPPDTDPVLDEPGLVEMLKHRAQQLGQAKVYPIGALTKNLQGESITEMAELTEAGCIAFSHAEAPIHNTQVLLRAMQYARTFDYAIWLRPQDVYLSQNGVAHQGPLAGRLGLVGIPVEAELVALQTYITLARLTQVKLHICRVSSAAGIELIRQAKREGLRITCDVSIHHVHLCDMDLGFFNGLARLNPPLRSDRDRDAITQGLLDGTIDAICSDHTPVDDDNKSLPFAEAEPGATGLELLLPLTLKWAKAAFKHDDLAVACAKGLNKITQAPADILGLSIGSFNIGNDADFCVIDPDLNWVVKPSQLFSQGHNTPFVNYELQGCVLSTWVNGREVFKKQHIKNT